MSHVSQTVKIRSDANKEQSTAQEASSSIEHLVTNPIDAADKDNVSVKSSDVLVDTSDGNHPAPVEAHKDPETTVRSI